MAFDLDDLEALLIAAARAGEPLTYSDALAALGYRFTRPLMRQLCAALCEVDSRTRGRGDPELAVLVVRQSDGLPGQGWWLSERDYTGAREGAEAQRHVLTLHKCAFARWSGT